MPKAAGSPAEPLDWGARLLYDAPVGALSPLRGLEQLFPGVAPFALTPGCYRSRLRREIQFLLIVNLLKLTPSSKPVPCPLRASETSPLVIA